MAQYCSEVEVAREFLIVASDMEAFHSIRPTIISIHTSINTSVAPRANHSIFALVVILFCFSAAPAEFGRAGVPQFATPRLVRAFRRCSRCHAGVGVGAAVAYAASGPA